MLAVAAPKVITWTSAYLLRYLPATYLPEHQVTNNIIIKYLDSQHSELDKQAHVS
jgi:hypothetical protein